MAKDCTTISPSFSESLKAAKHRLVTQKMLNQELAKSVDRLKQLMFLTPTRFNGLSFVVTQQMFRMFSRQSFEFRILNLPTVESNWWPNRAFNLIQHQNQSNKINSWRTYDASKSAEFLSDLNKQLLGVKKRPWMKISSFFSINGLKQSHGSRFRRFLITAFWRVCILVFHPFQLELRISF